MQRIKFKPRGKCAGGVSITSTRIARPKLDQLNRVRDRICFRRKRGQRSGLNFGDRERNRFTFE